METQKIEKSTAKNLRSEFKKVSGINWENEQGEPDIDYVIWLENRITPYDVPTSNEIIKEAGMRYRPDFINGIGTERMDIFIEGAFWALNKYRKSINKTANPALKQKQHGYIKIEQRNSH